MTFSRRAAATTLLPLMLVVGSAAAEVLVRIAPAQSGGGCMAQALVLVAKTPDGAGETRVPIDAATSSARVAAGSVVRADAPQCWSESIDTNDEAEVTITVHAAARFAGTLESAGERWPVNVHGTAFIASAKNGHPLQCAFEAPRWTCTGPAGVPFDLRLDAEGFAPVHYWDVIARGDRDRELEPRALHAGGSVSGWLEGPDGKPVANARIMLTPVAHATGEDARAAHREIAARSNRRGYFQLTGVGEGEYRLVSKTDQLSPVVLPVVNVREGETLTWPRTIVHLPFASLELQLSPPTDSAGKPWRVAISEYQPVATTPAPPYRRPATTDGTWRADRLRADHYRVAVEDEQGAVVERFVVDLTKSGTTHVPLTIRRTIVHGVLRVGDEPLQAEIRFTHRDGRTARATTDEAGRFEVRFPAAGRWSPKVHPGGEAGAQIRADDITVPEPSAEPVAIDIVLPGGRIRGQVSSAAGAPVKAAVHVAANGQLIAQQLTDDDGRFDFIGIDEARYLIDAEGNEGSAPPQQVQLEDGATIEVSLKLEPYRSVRAHVLTPAGAPASGALVRISADGGLSWSDIHTDVHGRFETMASGTTPLQAIVLTHSYPALITELRDAATLKLQPRGGKVRARHRAFIGRNGGLAALQMFYMPPSPLGIHDGAAYLEPGLYTVCSEVLTSRCRSITVNPGTEQVLEQETSQ